MSEKPFVQIRQRTGNFNFPDPSETSTRVRVEISAYDFCHEFKFGENFPPIEDLPWTEALEEIVYSRPRLIGDRQPHERLDEILSEHDGEIEEQWEQHRVTEIEDEVESLRSEKENLS